MKKILMPVIVLVAGTGVGGAAGYAATAALRPSSPTAASTASAPQVATRFVPVDQVIAPLVMPDGRLSGYVEFAVQLEVPEDQADAVTVRLPLLLHAINMRTYRTPLAAGPDGMLPDIGGLRAVVMAAAPEAFGPGVVRRVAVTQATPA